MCLCSVLFTVVFPLLIFCLCWMSTMWEGAHIHYHVHIHHPHPSTTQQTAEERRQLAASEQELLELKTMLVWGEADSTTPTFVRYRDFECLQQKLGDLQQQLRQVMQQGIDPQGPQGLVAREYIRLRGRVLELQRVIEVLLLVLCHGYVRRGSTSS